MVAIQLLPKRPPFWCHLLSSLPTSTLPPARWSESNLRRNWWKPRCLHPLMPQRLCCRRLTRQPQGFPRDRCLRPGLCGACKLASDEAARRQQRKLFNGIHNRFPIIRGQTTTTVAHLRRLGTWGARTVVHLCPPAALTLAQRACGGLLHSPRQQLLFPFAEVGGGLSDHFVQQFFVRLAVHGGIRIAAGAERFGGDIVSLAC